MTRGALVLFLLAAIAVLGTLGVRPLYKADESRYAQAVAGCLGTPLVTPQDWARPIDAVALE